ncbi:MAG: DUF4410 domain-containing protein [Deltaproteobacteria bacterium]|nr:DUF4410 domain-containing protein [Deltaproteobacteria bacterium]
MKKNIYYQLVVIGLVILLIGCGASKTMVINPVSGENKTKASVVGIGSVESTVGAPQAILEKISNTLLEKLQKTGAFDTVTTEDITASGGAVKLDVMLLQFNQGDQFKRWFWGGLGQAGQGSLTLRVNYKDGSTGEKIAEIQTEGSIDSGFFGGDFGQAINKALDEIVNYTVKNFGKT